MTNEYEIIKAALERYSSPVHVFQTPDGGFALRFQVPNQPYFLEAQFLNNQFVKWIVIPFSE